MSSSQSKVSNNPVQGASQGESEEAADSQVIRWGLGTRITLTLMLFVTGAGTTLKLGELISEKEGPALPAVVWLLLLLIATAFLVWASAIVWLGGARPLLSKRVSITILCAVVLGMVVSSLLLPDSFDVQADRDEALEIAANRLWAGLDPWGQSTHLGGFISPFLGGILLTSPFVVLTGNSTLQLLVVGVIGLVYLVRRAGYRAASAGFVVFTLSPVWLNELIFEHDIAFNAFVVAIAVGWTFFAMQGGRHPVPNLVGAGVLMGLGVTNRFFFLAVAFLMAVVLLRMDIRRALIWLTATGTTVLALFAVSVLAWPDSVDRILEHSVAKSDSVDIPGSALILAGLMIVVVLLGAWLARTASHVYLVAGAALALMPIWLVLLESLGSGQLALTSYLSQTYWAPCLVFGLLGFVMPRTPLVSDRMSRRAKRPTEVGPTTSERGADILRRF